jgi:hypothetical protein
VPPVVWPHEHGVHEVGGLKFVEPLTAWIAHGDCVQSGGFGPEPFSSTTGPLHPDGTAGTHTPVQPLLLEEEVVVLLVLVLLVLVLLVLVLLVLVLLVLAELVLVVPVEALVVAPPVPVPPVPVPPVLAAPPLDALAPL